MQATNLKVSGAHSTLEDERTSICTPSSMISLTALGHSPSSRRMATNHEYPFLQYTRFIPNPSRLAPRSRAPCASASETHNGTYTYSMALLVLKMLATDFFSNAYIPVACLTCYGSDPGPQGLSSPSLSILLIQLISIF